LTLSVLGQKNLQAFTAAFQAFPTRVYVPAGTYSLSDEWRLDFNSIPGIPIDVDNNPVDTFLDFEVEGAGNESTFLIQDENARAASFVGIYGDYQNRRTWASGKFHGLKLLSRKDIGLKVQNPRIRVTDLQLIVTALNGTGIELEKNSIGCYFEHIQMTGPAPYNGGTTNNPISANFTPCDPTQISPDFNPDDTTLSSGFKCPGRNVATTTISRLVVGYFDIGINLFARDGGIVGLQILFCEFLANQIGINIKNFREPTSRSLQYSSFDIIGNYMEMSPADRTFGIRFDPADPPYNVHVEGGHIDPKCHREDTKQGPETGLLKCRPMEVHGNYNIIDVPYHGEVYGSINLNTQVRSGTDLRCSLDVPGPYLCTKPHRLTMPCMQR